MTFNLNDLIENLHDGLYLVDRERRINTWNRSAERITGYSAQEVKGRCCSDSLLVHVDSEGVNLCEGRCPLAHTLEDGEAREAEVYLKHRAGHRVPVWVRVTPVRDEEGNIVAAAELFTDMSQHEAVRLRVQELEQLALLDPLTSLANRRFVEGEIQARLAELERFGIGFGLLFMDVDFFKRFNDTFGHQAGDNALLTLARTLSAAARPFDLFGRWGGEEFVGIIRNVDLLALTRIAERCRVLIEQSLLDTPSGQTRITVSVGGAVAHPGDQVDSLVERADRMMYQSKREGRNLVRCC
jgi:diguanylate cyclase (GGDEF)-like protein/PAS domain S-box-containing protein